MTIESSTVPMSKRVRNWIKKCQQGRTRKWRQKNLRFPNRCNRWAIEPIAPCRLVQIGWLASVGFGFRFLASKTEDKEKGKRKRQAGKERRRQMKRQCAFLPRVNTVQTFAPDKGQANLGRVCAYAEAIQFVHPLSCRWFVVYQSSRRRTKRGKCSKWKERRDTIRCCPETNAMRM